MMACRSTRQTNLLEISDVGLNALYVADCRALAEMADHPGPRRKTAGSCAARGDKYAAALATLWDEKSGMYLNRRTDTGESFATAFSHQLLSADREGAHARSRPRRMIQEHYFNPREFHGEWVMPSIARNVPGYADQDYWRGRIWGPDELPGLSWAAEL